MLRLQLLPTGLLTLIFASLTLAQQPTATVSVSPNDPLRGISKFAPLPHDDPVCCLRPLPSSEPAEELLMSFEEWKERQERTFRGDNAKDDAAKPNKHPTPPDTPSEANGDSGQSEESQRSEKLVQNAPAHFRVPITDRFNFASSDCSARVHYSHRSARSTSSLLSNKKDKYMLSPCNTPGEDKFVVVELCDFIRIDTVQLANFEFFSGIFKDFSVSVAPTYVADPDSWTFAGTFRAKNIRGIQTFHPDTTTLRGFYRFIRIDFHSHYGNEFYCPVSLLRVYGLTDLEQWKWDAWEAEYIARQEALERRVIEAGQTSSAGMSVQVIKGTSDYRAQSKEGTVIVNTSSKPSLVTVDTAPLPTTISPPSSIVEAFTTATETVQTPSSSSLASTSTGNDFQTDNPSFPSTSALTSSVTGAETQTSSVSQLSEVRSSKSAQSESSPTPAPSLEASPSDSPSSSSSTSTSVQTTVVTQEQRPPPGGGIGAGESIYRTIMTRLSMLEANSTLYLRYVEEQTRSMRGALRRLEEDLGRLEGITKAQGQFLERTVAEWERQRKRLERDHGDLQARVDNLADEVVLEKRLGIAQLCLLLTVLVFLVLTRGSRGEPISFPLSNRRHDSLKEWGRRQLSGFGSGEWGRSGHEDSHSSIPSQEFKKIDKVNFPASQTPEFKISASQPISHKSQSGGTPTRKRTPSEIRAPHPRHFVSHRPKTPSSANFHPPRSPAHHHGHSQSAALPPQSGSPRPRLRRTHSQNTPPSLPHSLSLSTGLATAPLSAKKFAKTAHLHEIRKFRNDNSPLSPANLGPPAIQTGSGERGLEEALRSLSPRLEPTKPPGSDTTTFWLETPPHIDPQALFDARRRNGDWLEGARDKTEFDNRPGLSQLTLPPSITDVEQSDTLTKEDDSEFLLGSPYRSRDNISELSVERPKVIIDVDTESESWVDTDIESSDMGERSPIDVQTPF